MSGLTHESHTDLISLFRELSYLKLHQAVPTYSYNGYNVHAYCFSSSLPSVAATSQHHATHHKRGCLMGCGI